MEIRRALRIFRLQKRIPIEELNSVFRNLVKKYHPDKMREYPEWAHERMSEINDAYETLVEWLLKPPIQKKPRPAPTPFRKEATETVTPRTDAFFRKETPQLSGKEGNVFYPVFHLFLDGLGVYYQYGLENPIYRGEGIRRFRYREALRIVQKARDDFEKYSIKNMHPVYSVTSRFVQLTVREMEFGEPIFANMTKFRKIDNKFRTARRNFNMAVKEVFFPELIPGHLSGQAVSGLYTCYASFALYLSYFDEGERRNAGRLMTARYHALMSLLELRSEGILKF